MLILFLSVENNVFSSGVAFHASVSGASGMDTHWQSWQKNTCTWLWVYFVSYFLKHSHLKILRKNLFVCFNGYHWSSHIPRYIRILSLRLYATSSWGVTQCLTQTASWYWLCTFITAGVKISRAGVKPPTFGKPVGHSHHSLTGCSFWETIYDTFELFKFFSDVCLESL